MLLGVAAAAGLVAGWRWLASCGGVGCPTAEDLRRYRPPEGSVVLDREGRPLGRLTYVRRVNVPLAQVPAHVREAFIATEDRRFWKHEGVDWRAVGRATLRNVRALGIREGSSTITMQLVRNAFLPRLAQERSFRRKLLEFALAWRMEEVLTKEEILQLYLNVIYLGNGVYGVEAASRDLFGKSVEDVTVAEAATLAALPKAPSSYAPRANPKRATARRNLVLGLMVREGYLTEAEAERAGRTSLKVAKKPWTIDRDTTMALDAVRLAVDSILGTIPEEERRDVGDLVVHTTIDARAQDAAETAVRAQAGAIDRAIGRRAARGREIQGAMVAIDPRTGAIRAVVGAREHTPRGFNRALHAKRQPGSTFKPFVYAAAIREGFSPATLVLDEPVEVVDDEGKLWRPANHGGYAGQITLRRALSRSANAATVRISQAVGLDDVVAIARSAGITSPLPAVPALALGSAEVTPVELVAAYAPFANGGWRVRPTLVQRIELPEGGVLWQAPAQPREQVLDNQDAFLMTTLLRSVVDHGTGLPIRELGVRGPVAGKTGTTNDGADVWFVGFTPSVVAGVWFGYDTPAPIGGGTGGDLAAPAWARWYQKGWAGRTPEREWQPPAGIVTRTIDRYNGFLATEWCPEVRTEYFDENNAPTDYCPEHRGSTFDRIERGVSNFFKRVFGL